MLSLREAHSSTTRSSKVKPVKVGDVVILRDELTKRAFWKLGIVKELLTGKDDIARAAIVRTVSSEKSQLLRRSVKHLIPLELNTNLETSDDTSVTSSDNEHQDFPSNSQLAQRRTAAISGEKRRRLNN